MRKHYSEYFCGNKISDYGLRNGYIDYRTFANAFDCVLNNNVISFAERNGEYFDLVSGNYDEESEVFQWYIVSDSGAELIKEYEVGILYYCDELDMYLWGITHYGTSWDHVLTDIAIEIDRKE